MPRSSRRRHGRRNGGARCGDDDKNKKVRPQAAHPTSSCSPPPPPPEAAAVESMHRCTHDNHGVGEVSAPASDWDYSVAVAHPAEHHHIKHRSIESDLRSLEGELYNSIIVVGDDDDDDKGREHGKEGNDRGTCNKKQTPYLRFSRKQQHDKSATPATSSCMDNPNVAEAMCPTFSTPLHDAIDDQEQLSESLFYQTYRNAIPSKPNPHRPEPICASKLLALSTCGGVSPARVTQRAEDKGHEQEEDVSHYNVVTTSAPLLGTTAPLERESHTPTPPRVAHALVPPIVQPPPPSPSSPMVTPKVCNRKTNASTKTSKIVKSKKQRAILHGSNVPPPKLVGCPSSFVTASPFGFAVPSSKQQQTQQDRQQQQPQQHDDNRSSPTSITDIFADLQDLALELSQQQSQRPPAALDHGDIDYYPYDDSSIIPMMHVNNCGGSDVESEASTSVVSTTLGSMDTLSQDSTNAHHWCGNNAENHDDDQSVDVDIGPYVRDSDDKRGGIHNHNRVNTAHGDCQVENGNDKRGGVRTPTTQHGNCHYAFECATDVERQQQQRHLHDTPPAYCWFGDHKTQGVHGAKDWMIDHRGKPRAPKVFIGNDGRKVLSWQRHPPVVIHNEHGVKVFEWEIQHDDKKNCCVLSSKCPTTVATTGPAKGEF